MTNPPDAPMHPDEIAISVDLVQRLIARQFPRWASLPLARFPSGDRRVELRYRPRSLAIGAWLSLAGLAGIAALALCGPRAARR